MASVTYREIFNQALEEWIAAGGDVARTVTLVNVYQGSDPTARHFAFRDWLGTTRVPCSRCGFGFQPDPEEADEAGEVLCVWCIKGSLYRHLPGWVNA